MPSNPVPVMSTSQPSSATKSPLVRSKSLRLPPAKPKPEASVSTLTRHGSIRQTKGASAFVKQQPLSVLRKPVVKPKPVFGSKSTENLTTVRGSQNIELDAKKQLIASKSPIKQADLHYAKGVTFSNDSSQSPSDSPSSLHSDKSQRSRDTSWAAQDLTVHVKRLAEEHEKLQVEYARQRMQVLDLAASNPNLSLRRDLQYLSHSDSQLASIPENSGGSSSEANAAAAQNHEAVVQIYRNEISRLQDENRKLQRKFWEQVLSTESIEDEVNGGASQQVVELIDKLDDKQRELVQASGRVQELENHLAATTLELQQCQDALQDYQRMLEESNVHREKLEKVLKEANATITDMRETVEFLQEERSTIAEALQETEQCLQITQAEKKVCDTRLNDLMTRARRLYSKVQEKNMSIQVLTAELDRSEGRARDMLLSQGAELTMTAMNVSEISITLHNMITSASEFAANKLELQKEILDEIMTDLDSDSDKNENCELSPLDDICQSFKVLDIDIMSKDLLHQTMIPDMHKSLPDLPSSQLLSSPHLSSSVNGSNGSISIVQAIINAAEGQKEKQQDPENTSSQQTLSSDGSAPNSVQSSSENLLSTVSDTNVGKVSFGRSGAFKPVGTAIPFRPVSQSYREVNSTPAAAPDVASTDDEKKKGSLEGQLKQLGALLSQLNKVIELSQGKYLSKIAGYTEDKAQLQEEIAKYKQIEKCMQNELKAKVEQNEKLSVRLSELSNELKVQSQSFIHQKEELLKEISELKESNKCFEASKKELTRQLKEEVQMIAESALKKQGAAHFSDALAICDKLSLKQEIASLKEKVSQKEMLLQNLAQKFAKTKKILEDDIQQTKNEVECLDAVIQRVYETLQSNLELVESSDVIKEMYNLVSKSIPSKEIKATINKDAEGP